MSWEESLPFPQQAWEVSAVPTALEGEASHAAWKFLLLPSESFRKRNTAALALLWFFHHGPACGFTPLLCFPTFPCTERAEEYWGLSIILSNLSSPSAVARFPPFSVPSQPPASLVLLGPCSCFLEPALRGGRRVGICSIRV